MIENYFSDGLNFETWWNSEGKDMLPIKDSVEIAWKNGAFIAREEIESRTCESCKYYDLIMPQNNPHDQYNYMGCQELESFIPPTHKFSCNKWEQK